MTLFVGRWAHPNCSIWSQCLGRIRPRGGFQRKLIVALEIEVWDFGTKNETRAYMSPAGAVRFCKGKSDKAGGTLWPSHKRSLARRESQ